MKYTVKEILTLSGSIYIQGSRLGNFSENAPSTPSMNLRWKSSYLLMLLRHKVKVRIDMRWKKHHAPYWCWCRSIIQNGYGNAWFLWRSKVGDDGMYRRHRWSGWQKKYFDVPANVKRQRLSDHKVHADWFFKGKFYGDNKLVMISDKDSIHSRHRWNVPSTPPPTCNLKSTSLLTSLRHKIKVPVMACQ